MAVDMKRVPKSERAAVRKLTRQSEAAFQQQIIELAQTCGWLAHAERPAVSRGKWSTPIQGDPGFPDLVLAHPTHGIVFAELKSSKGLLSGAQAEWQMVIGQRTDRIFVWRPSDWPEIEAVLGGCDE